MLSRMFMSGAILLSAPGWSGEVSREGRVSTRPSLYYRRAELQGIPMDFNTYIALRSMLSIWRRDIQGTINLAIEKFVRDVSPIS